MAQVAAQVQLLTEEVATLKTELIAVKGAHATLHQQSVDANTQHNLAMTQMESRLEKAMKEAGDNKGGKTKSLIEPKNIVVDIFSGAITDTRAKFLEWGERARDRAALFDDCMSDAMLAVEVLDDPVTKEKSEELGITAYASRELHAFLKDRTNGTANSIVRSNKTGLGLESWRMLAKQFNPRTLQATKTAQDLETKPRGQAKSASCPLDCWSGKRIFGDACKKVETHPQIASNV